MEEKNRMTGLDVVGDVPWGTHLCVFYHTREDLLDILVPYFTAGLENNEFCMWVTSEPLSAEAAKRSLQKAVRNLDAYIEKGQIEILDYRQWYTESGRFDADKVLQGWVAKENQAVKRGFDGLRLTGNTFWLEARDWARFTEYEATVNRVIGQYRMLAICTYSLDRCGAAEVMDVVSNHEFALVKREGKWTRIESAEHKRAEEQIESLSRFPAENPNPVLRLQRDGTLMYANPGARPLLQLWGCEVGQRVPADWAKLVADSMASGAGKEVEVACDKRIYSFILVPVQAADYVNAYGLDITDRKRAEEALKKHVHDLGERVKELSCLYRVSELARKPGTSQEELLQATAELLPLAWQYPEVTCARIILRDQEFRTENFRESAWKQTGAIMIDDKRAGAVEVCYLEERPRSDEGPFLKEERNLLDAIANLIQGVTEGKQAEKAVQKSEQLVRAVVEASLDAIVAVNAEGRIVLFNDAAQELFQYSKEDALKQPAKILLREETGPIHQERLERFLNTGVGQCGHIGRRMEKVFRRRDGSLFEAEVSMSGGRLDGLRLVVLAVHDITDRQRAEEALRESEEKHRRLFETMAQGAVYQNAEGHIISANPAAERLLGLTLAQMLGRTSMDSRWKAIHEDGSDFPGDTHPAMIALKTGNEVSHVVMGVFHPSANEYVWINIHATPQFRPGETKPYQVYTTFDDITERRQAEEALRESEKRYRILAANATDVIWNTDLDLRHTYVSPSVMRLRGVTVEEAMAEKIEETLTPSSVQIVRKALAEELSNEAKPQKDPFRSRTLELEQTCKDGSTVWTEVRASFLRDLEGRPSGLLGITRDISERKQAERQRVHLEAQLSQAQKMEAVGRLAGGIAHDFNNTMMVINGYAQLVLRKLSPRHPLRQSINEIRKAGERAASLTGQLLAFSRRQILVPEILDLNRVVAGTEEMLRRVIGEDVELVIRQGHKLAKVLADPSQMAQVLVNLAVNARDAMPKGGRLTIETGNVDLREGEIGKLPGAAPGRYVMLTVSDTGVGMSKEVMERMFEPFFTTKEPGRGTGLGLATVYGIVSQSGGYVRAQSEPGQGSTFRVYLPCAQVSPGKPAARSTKGRLTKGRETVLVVEDELAVRQVVAQALRSSGYKVLEAGSGEQAMNRLRQHEGPLHLVLTDLVMPRMNGREVADSVRTLYPEVKVVFMSGYTNEALLGHGVSGAPASFLQKPFTVEVLSQKVREVLKRT